MERPAVPGLVIAVVQGRTRLGQQFGELRLALDERPRGDVVAVEIQKIEQEEHQRRGVAAVRRKLDRAERGDAVGAHAAQLAVEIGLAGAERRHGGGDRRVLMRPIEPGAGEQPHRAMIEAGRACGSRCI